ncbi:hypothetical protein [Cupriavidus basilensis]|uniref:hypothetical protein n=1 Tax=Cupriavidus basilensis TaxID=68895 RepID=UPI000750EB2B|nr:hypothetical protein [Cupriavidus basilensis]
MKRIIGAAAISLVLAGCGGSGDNDSGLALVRTPPAAGSTPTDPTTPVTPVTPVVPPAPDTNAIGTGIFNGSTPDGQRVNVLVLDENAFYIFYSAPGVPDVPMGVITGNYSSNNDTLTTNNNGLDFNLEAAGYNLTAANFNGSFVPSTLMQTQLTYRNARNTAFTANYSTDYNYIATVDGLRGDYSGSAVALDTSGMRSDGITMHVDATGNITVDAGAGCAFTGTATPRRQGKVYNVSLQFGAAPCRYPNTTMTGIAYYDPTTTHSLPTLGQLYLFVMRADRQAGMIFTGKH